MSYTEHTWVNDEVITASKLNNIETGISEAMQSGGGGYDAEISITDADGIEFTIISGNFATLSTLVSQNIAPNILVRIWSTTSTLGYTLASSSAVAIYGVWLDASVPYINFICKFPTAVTTGTYSNEWKSISFYWNAEDEVNS